MKLDRRAFLIAVGVVAALSVGPSGDAANGGRPLRATLTGAAEVPTPGDPDGSGTIRLRVNPGHKRICYEIRVRGIAAPTAAHIHLGRAGVAGDVVVPLTAPFRATSDPTVFTASGCVTVAERATIRAILKNPAGYYVNVHNADFPAGALRGQLAR